MKMTGIVFSNIYDTSMGDLTKYRTVASLPFGGRYRQVDFVLSNMCNSGIRKVGIITKYNYQSLMDHLVTSAEWDFNIRGGGLYFLPPFSSGGTSGVYRGKLEALYNAITFLEHCTEEYVVMCDSTTICNIDFEDVLESHIASGKDITAITVKASEYDKNRNSEMIIKMRGKDVKSLAVNTFPKKGDIISTGMYIMERENLLEIVKDSVAHGLCYFEKDFLQRQFINDNISINVFQFEDVLLRNSDILSYYNNNLKLLEEDIHDGIFKEGAPIYTKVRDEEPSFYYEGSKVDNCLIADGCQIKGTVENSIIFRDVKIEKGAVVKNSVVMQGTVIKSGANIENAIMDKDVTIEENRTLVGAKTAPLIINKGETV